MAPAKHATTMIVQRALPRLDLDLEIWLRPWTVAFSKNSEKIAKFILDERRAGGNFTLPLPN